MKPASARPIEVQVLPPEPRPRPGDLYDLIARLMDSAFRVPGTNFRFGLDPLIGLIPGAGDSLAGLISILLLTQGFRAGVPRLVVVRMAWNILLNTALGAIPIVGDAFSFWFKSNLRNQELLHRHTNPNPAQRTQARRGDRLFVTAIILGLLLALALVVTAILALATALLGSLNHLLTR